MKPDDSTCPFLVRFLNTCLAWLTIILLTSCGGGTSEAPQAATPADPTVSIANAAALEGDSGAVNLNFTVTLSVPTDHDVTMDYHTDDDSVIDYTPVSGTLTVPAGQTIGTVSVPVLGDTDFEPSKSFTVNLVNPTGATLSIASAVGTIVNDDPGGLNDTGINSCGDYAFWGSNLHNNDVDCSSAGATAITSGTDGDGDPVIGGQDAHFGRDANPLTNSDADGHGGFSFTRVCNNGVPAGQAWHVCVDVDKSWHVVNADERTYRCNNGLPVGQEWNDCEQCAIMDCPADPVLGSEQNDWGCTMDNVTGLLWEIKTDDDGLRDRDWTYTWYSSDPAVNGGNPEGIFNNQGNCLHSDRCGTENYVADVNDATLCGHADWRLPTRRELKSLVDHGMAGPDPAIDARFFPDLPNTRQGWFWTSSPFAADADKAWCVGFNDIVIDYGDKNLDLGVRLVRGWDN